MKRVVVLMLLVAVAIGFQGCIEEELVDVWGEQGTDDGQFDEPRGVETSPLGYVYVADTYNHRIQKFTMDGEYLDQWGEYGSANGQFSYPVDIAVDRHGNVYVADAMNHRIQKFTMNGAHLATWGKEGSGTKEFNQPLAIAVDLAGYVYVADSKNKRVQKFDSSGNFIPSQWDEPDSQISRPSGIAVNRQNEVYVSDWTRHQIKKFTSQGQLLKSWGGFAFAVGGFYAPQGLAIDPWGDLYVVDCGNHRLQKFTPEGEFITHFGCAGSGRGDFFYPYGIAIDRQGNIYVADTENHRIQKFWFGHFYQITPAISYLPQSESLRILAQVYDLSGRWVIEGNARFLITKEGKKIDGGKLRFDETTNYWRAGPFWFAEKGELLLTVVVNGQSTSMEFTVAPSTTTVRGSVQDEEGKLVEGLTVELYRARDLISEIVGPEPVQITTSGEDGFVFNNVNPDRYIIISKGPTGTAYSPAFWVFGQEETVVTNISLSPNRVALIEDFGSLKQKLQKQMFLQTLWMKEVSEMADLDLVLSPDLLDEYKLLTIILKSLSERMRDLDSKLATGAQKITLEVFAELLFEPAIASGLREETQGYLNKVSITGIYPWYFDYADENSRQRILRGFPGDLEWLQGNGNFGQGEYSHRVSEYQQRAIYLQASAMLEEALAATQTNFPQPTSRFSYQGADLILRQGLATLESIERGTDQIYVVPEAANPYGSISLHLYDYYNHYRNLREKRGQVKVLEKVGADLSLIYTGGAFICLGSLVTAEAAPIFAAAAWIARSVEKVASYYEQGYDAVLLSAFRLMCPKYLSNLGLTPFAYAEFEKFLRKEVESPYYLDKGRSFEAKITNIQLMGGGARGDRLVAFPQQGPFAPKILVTEEVPAKVEVQVGEGFSPAELRVEMKIEGPLGIYDQTMSEGVHLGPGDSYVFDVPFKGCLTSNTLGERSKMEFRLWAGPFQVFTATSDFMVVFPKEGESQTKGVVALSQKGLEECSERLREKEVIELAVGQNIISRDFQMPDDVFSCQFRAYRPLGVGIRMRVSDGRDFVGYDPELGAAGLGFPAEYSGLGSNPEVISIPNAAGRKFTITLELDDLISEPVRVILEVWETPYRPAALVLLPNSMELTLDSSATAWFSSSIGESSQQQALRGVKIELSELKNSQAQEIDWDVSLSNALRRGIVLAGRIESFEVKIEAQGADAGIYAGQITVSSTNAGEIVQPVRVIVPLILPEVQIIQERQSGNFVLSWPGKTNQVYQIQISEDLKDWSVVDEKRAENNGHQSWTDQNWQGVKRRFYRLKLSGG